MALRNDLVLRLRGFGVAYAQKVVLAEIDLDVPLPGMMVLLGPCGTGKSTLLRTLCGLAVANPSLRTWGRAEYSRHALGTGAESPALVAQSAKLMMSSVFENLICNLPQRDRLTRSQQRDLIDGWLRDAGLEALDARLQDPVVKLDLALQRHIAIVREVASDPRLLCLDEPTAGLNDAESERLIAHLKREATRRALIVSTHNQSHARQLGGRVALLAGGRIQEDRPTAEFFAAPATDAGRDFVRTGTCLVPAPDAVPEDLDESIPPPPPLPPAARENTAGGGGPRGFLWLRRGALAGTPLPGVFHELDYDLAALKCVGIRHLVNLTEQAMDPLPLSRFGITTHWFPVPDMFPPVDDQAVEICELLERLIAAGEPVAVHCRAGQGRTGTVLAMHLIWNGSGALEALEHVRRIDPRWVQSQAQVDALQRFVAVVAKARISRKGAARANQTSTPVSAVRQTDFST